MCQKKKKSQTKRAREKKTRNYVYGHDMTLMMMLMVMMMIMGLEMNNKNANRGETNERRERRTICVPLHWVYCDDMTFGLKPCDNGTVFIFSQFSFCSTFLCFV